MDSTHYIMGVGCGLAAGDVLLESSPLCHLRLRRYPPCAAQPPLTLVACGFAAGCLQQLHSKRCSTNLEAIERTCRRAFTRAWPG